MANQYTSFLQSPTTSLLAADATLVYVTTTTEIQEPTAILKHIQSQQKQVVKKDEKVLNAIEGQDGLCLETETTLLFKTGGGAYLPGVDENFLDERTVTFPLTHVVRFDAEKKIKQMRLYWDQGTLLKQVEVIGRTGRNWPIKDGKAQIQAVTKSLNAGGRTIEINGTSSQQAHKGPHNGVASQQQKRGSMSATRDPHASLNLFGPRDPTEESEPRFDGPGHAIRESMAPQSRDLNQILAGNDEDTPMGSNVRSPSPVKGDGVILKSGAGKHHKPNRLFDENEPPAEPRSPEKKKTYADKHSHFEFGDNGDAPAQQRPASSRASRNNQTQIKFEDFSSPLQVREKTRPDYERHWGAGVDADDPQSPVKRPVVHAARPDADTHFEFTDESPAPAEKGKSFQRQKGMGLYQDPLYADDRTALKGNSRAAYDFGPQYSIADSSPVGQQATKASGKARGDMDSHWSHESPVKEKQIYKTAGDGMGGRKAMTRSWGFGDESDPEVDNANVRPSTRSKGGRQRDMQYHTEAGAGQF
ncbi:hypothetical protein BAUCODRAFT_26718 [Baudoinia panamericana UAMH 10762]|uniref:Uncharacterized protein n=1 Tax=Baudoinia panamericana (strain UAMH 10762) TaxID=717646 RepID=M2LH26_BAUPA|nr:uncharacterized protein BAUCODRAFT_26718 [Baudoinia panamericana UAMH 10762]EMC93427.1 hypothetical protein BAUCODRAFT_26718 [Baudoinia panamericana UAMH 10762]